MKKQKYLFKRAITYTFSIVFMIAVVAACSQDNKNQTAQETEAPQEKPQPQVSRQADTTEVVEEMPAEQPKVARVVPEQELASVGLKPRNNPILKSISVKYQDWDTNGDNILRFDEFYNGLYKVWDENKDKSVDQKEFDRAVNNFFADYNFKESGKFSDWDTDGNKKLSQQEFNNNMKKITGGKNKPLSERLFIVWNQDNDDNIEKIELDNGVVVVLNNNNN